MVGRLLAALCATWVTPAAGVRTTMDGFIAESSTSFRYSQQVAVPSLGSLRDVFANITDTCEVLIRVRASSVNPTDRHADQYRLPKVLGSDVSGEVIAVESGCQRLRRGDRVWGDIGANAFFPNGTQTKELGAYGTYAVALETQLGVFPETLGYVEAGTLPKVSLTSYKALVWYAGAPWKTDDTVVLVLGGSGGTGTVGIQLAKAFGASKVITTTSEANAAYCRSLGADEVIDYHVANWWDVLQPDSVDVVYDTVGQRGTADRAMKIIRTNGSFVTIAGSLSNHPKPGVHQHFFINSDTNLDNYGLLDDLSELAQGGRLRMPSINGTYALSDVAEAFQQSAGGHVVGKIAIRVD